MSLPENTSVTPTNSELHPSGIVWRAKYAAFLSLNAANALLRTDTPLRELAWFHRRDILTMEGYMRPTQFKWFKELFKQEPVKRIAEIGFNGGHSAFTFAYLGATSVTSFDIGEHDYVPKAADFLVRRFPETDFELVLGDSQETVPAYSVSDSYDAVFIDGSHTLEAATADIANMRRLTEPGSLVIMDDYTDRYPWRTGPKVAYDRAVCDGVIEHLETASGDRRTWALGKYRAT